MALVKERIARDKSRKCDSLVSVILFFIFAESDPIKNDELQWWDLHTLQKTRIPSSLDTSPLHE